MAELATIARPYAEAAFSVALTGGTAGSPAVPMATWSTCLNELAQVASHPEVLSLATDPKVTPAQYESVLSGAVKTPLDAPLKHFLQMLVENHRVAALPQIAEQFESLMHAHEGRADAVITSAFPMDDAALRDLLVGLEKKFGSKLNARVVVDPSLIGGVSVAVGDEVLDTSVRARLAQMQAALIA